MVIEKMESSSKPVVPDADLCLIDNQLVYVPESICGNKDLLKSVFSLKMWNSFSAKQKKYLMGFLPAFTRNENAEKQKTIELLFSGSEFKFGVNPVLDFQKKLYAGLYRVDVVIGRKRLKNLYLQEYKRVKQLYYFNMLKTCIIEREPLLNHGEKINKSKRLLNKSKRLLNKSKRVLNNRKAIRM